MITYLSKDSLGCDRHYYWFLLQCSVIFQHKSSPPPRPPNLKKEGLVCPQSGWQSCMCSCSCQLHRPHACHTVVWRVVGQLRRQQVGVSLRPAGEQVTLSLTVSVHGVCLQRTRARMALCFFFFFRCERWTLIRMQMSLCVALMLLCGWTFVVGINYSPHNCVD